MPKRKLRIHFLLPALLVASVVSGSMAAEPDMSDVKSSLDKTMEALKAASNENEKLQKHEQKLKNELQNLQEDLVKTASKIRQQERLLSKLENGLRELNQEEASTRRDLESKQQELAAILGSMVKLSTVPPEMIIAMPGDFANTLRTAKVLVLTSETLHSKARKIRDQLKEIQSLRAEISESKAQISAGKKHLEKNQAALAGKLDTRGTLHSKLHARQKEHYRKLTQLSKQSGNLRDLLSQLESEREKEKQKAAKLALVPTPKPETRSAPSPRKEKTTDSGTFPTKISLPAEGNIFSFYGDKTEDGDTSKGIKIRTREAAQITAPSAGEVVYTGPFLDYGNLVILRHAENYHTLLAGLERISCEPGQRILEGEPVGEMGKTEQATSLYIEIRENNRPVDPEPWLKTKRLANKDR